MTNEANPSRPYDLRKLVMSVRVQCNGAVRPLQIWRTGDGNHYVRDVGDRFMSGAWIAGPYGNLEAAGAAMYALAGNFAN